MAAASTTAESVGVLQPTLLHHILATSSKVAAAAQRSRKRRTMMSNISVWEAGV